jgi:Tfp pilus assembly protein PilV
VPGCRRGLTLIEVLVAAMICTIALYVIIFAISTAQTAVVKGDYYNLASKAAADAIAADEANGYATLVNGTATTAVAGLPNGTLTITIGPLNGNPANTNIKEIDADVNWTGGSGASQLGGQVSLSTCVSAP